MSRDRIRDERVSEVLAGLEEVILRAGEAEVLADLGSADDAGEVRAMVALQLAQQRLNESPAGRARASTRKRGDSPARRAATDIALLKSLVASRPDLSRRLSAVFGSSRTPDENQMDELVDELIRLGGVSPKAPKR